MEVGSGAGVGGCDRGDWDGDEEVWEVELGVTGQIHLMYDYDWNIRAVLHCEEKLAARKRAMKNSWNSMRSERRRGLTLWRFL